MDMANKARTPMTKPEEVIAWAEATKAENGEAFTMLKKEEQLLIARFILAMRDRIKTLQNGMNQQGPVPTPQPAQTKILKEEDKPAEVEAPDEVEEPVEESVKDPEDEIVEERIILKQSNMEYFKANNVPMTRAYEMYCVWRNCDPENRTVYDNERKAWLKAAGFAYWLNLPHE